MANNVALSKLYKSGEPETPPEDYLPSFVALLKKAVGKGGRTAATIVHRTLMKKKFRLTQPVAEYINQQDGPEQKEDLALAYQLCCTLKLLDDDDLDALAGRGGADLVLEALSVAHSAVGSEARSLERLCSAAPPQLDPEPVARSRRAPHQEFEVDARSVLGPAELCPPKIAPHVT